MDTVKEQLSRNINSRYMINEMHHLCPCCSYPDILTGVTDAGLIKFRSACWVTQCFGNRILRFINTQDGSMSHTFSTCSVTLDTQMRAEQNFKIFNQSAFI